MFQRFAKKGRKAGQPGEPQLTVAAFGKHPGWDDHIPGLGVETEVLAFLMQNLYVGGIGRQIDSGAWEKLEPEKRLDGFDHRFLFLKDHDAVLGELWSSKDGKGRSKYPMVLCVHGEELDPEVLFDYPQAALKNAREGCRASESAHHVSIECQSTQDQLREWLKNQGPAKARPLVNDQARQSFLNHPALGPDALGLARVLHELDNASGRSPGRSADSSAAADLRPYHVRVPLGSDLLDQGMVLWAGLLRCVLPAGAPLLLVGRHGTGWLDLIVGDPGGDDLFCLQASPKALPLATDVPYDLAADMPRRVAALTAKFLGRSVPEAEAPTPTAPAAIPAPAKAQTSRAADTPPRGKAGVVGLVTALLILLAGGFYFWPKAGGPTPQQPLARVPAVSPAPPPTELATQTNSKEQEEKYQSALKASEEAVRRQDYAAALAQADIALALRPNDPAVTSLKADTQTRMAAAAQAKDTEQKYQAALKELQATLGRQDYAAALAQADSALALRPSDPAVTSLKADAQTRMAAATKAKDMEQKYQTALEALQAAIGRQEYPAALAQADAALALRPNDPAVTKLRADAQAQITSLAKAKEQEDKYQAALKEVQAAMSRKEYTAAVSQADAALALRPNDPAVTKLRADAQAQITSLAKVKEQEDKYQAAVKEVQAAMNRKEYTAAVRQADAALALRPNDPAITKLRADAQAQVTSLAKAKEQEDKYQAALKEVQAAMNRKEYTAAVSQADAALALRPNDPAVTKLRADAQAQITSLVKAKEQEDKYQAALKEVQAAMNRKDYTAAVRQADAALALRPNDPAVTKLRADAQAQVASLAKAKEQEDKYQAALKEVQAAISRKEYTAAVSQADAALALRPNDPAVTKLRADAQAQISSLAKAKEQEDKYQAALKEVQAAMNRKDYTAAVSQADAALALRPNDPAVMKLRADAQAQITSTVTEQAPVTVKNVEKSIEPSTNQTSAVQASPESTADILLGGLEARFVRKQDPGTVVPNKEEAKHIRDFTIAEALKKVKLLESSYIGSGLLNERKARLKALTEAIRNSKS